jgi:hypothetical protein
MKPARDRILPPIRATRGHSPHARTDEPLRPAARNPFGPDSGAMRL